MNGEQIIDHEADQQVFTDAFKESAEASIEASQVVETPQKVDIAPVKTDEPVKEVQVPDKKVDEPVDYKALYEASEKKARDAETQLATNTQQMKSWEGRLTVASNKIKELEAKGTITQKTDTGLLPDDEQKLVDAFEKEMGTEFTQPMSILVKKLVKQIVSDQLAGIQKTADESKSEVAKIVKEIEDETVRRHWEILEDQHPDIDAILKVDPATKKNDIHKYAEELPYGKGKEALDIIDHGSTKQVLKLLAEYKKARGIDTKKTDDKTKGKGKVEMQPVDTNRVKAAAAVKTGSPVILPKAEANKDDFVASFAEAVAKDEKK